MKSKIFRRNNPGTENGVKFLSPFPVLLSPGTACCLLLLLFAGCEKGGDSSDSDNNSGNGSTKSAACDITAFVVNSTAWTIDGTNITYTYPAGTAATPAITVSNGATVSPASGIAQDFFSAQGA